MKYWKMIVLGLAMVLVLSGCGKTEQPQAETEPSQTTLPTDPEGMAMVEEVTMVVTDATLFDLLQYPNLRRADLTGSTCYQSIRAYSNAHPEVEVLYSVAIGGREFPHTTQEITLEADNTDLTELLENLDYLPELTKLHLPRTKLDAFEIGYIQEKYPNIAITHTVELLGEEYDSNASELDLSDMQPEQVDQATEELARFPSVTKVELMSNGSSQLGVSDVKKLVAAVPGAEFHYTFSLFGNTISTNDESVTIKNVKISQDAETELREALSIMTGCQRFVLENSGLSNEALALIREDYPNTNLVWKVYFGKDSRYQAYTDTDTIRAVYNVYDDNVGPLQYCTKVKYIDMGHNDYLTNCSFLANMPDLEILILSGSSIRDLSGIENCKKLEFAEFGNCSYLEDITPLSGCEGLKHLNLFNCKVSSLEALDALPLEQLICKRTRVPAAEQKLFQELHPDCIAGFYGTQPYGYGWRYTDNGQTYTEIYKKVREVFRLDDPIPYSN